MQNKNNTIVVILLVVVIAVLAYIAFAKPKNININSEIPVGDTKGDADKSELDGTTYTYTNHGFSVELAKGYIPKENVSVRGNRTDIDLAADSMITYVTDVSAWEVNANKYFEYKGEEKIGETTFKVYLNPSVGLNLYWFKQGQVGYAFGGNKELLKTFKFVGWPQVQGSKEDLVSFSISPGQEVSGVIQATGVMKGGYFQEGNMPVTIIDINNKKVLIGANATSDWMTAEAVSFSVNLDFSSLAKGKAYVKFTQDDLSDGESGRIIRSVLVPVVIK